jgi:DNA topoisomerase-1
MRANADDASIAAARGMVLARACAVRVSSPRVERPLPNRSRAARADPADAAAADAAEPARRAAADRRPKAGTGRAGARAARPRAARGRELNLRRANATTAGNRRRAAPSATNGDAPPGLVWVSDDSPGIRRVRDGDGFAYIGANGRRIRSAAELERIRKLAIPPAYEEVWICTLANGHLQATGRDARGRKQYRYHPGWRIAKDRHKFDRMPEFGTALPRIRRRVQADLGGAIGTMPRRETVLATIVRLLDTTLVRIGNEEYARENRSFGLTTLRNRHAAVTGSTLRLRFRGKSGKEHEVALDDPRVARVVRRCQAMPGQELFRYVDEDGSQHGVDSADVNGYIREAAGADFTAKDFRTWHGTAHALALWIERSGDGKRPSAKELLAEVASRLGNTVAVCRKSYVHPRVLYALSVDSGDEPRAVAAGGRKGGLDVHERRLLAFLARP